MTNCNSGPGTMPDPGRLDTAMYRQAVNGEGDLAEIWKMQPQRLIFDLASEVDHVRTVFGRVDPEHGPELMSRDQFADLLLDLAHRVRTGDSFEGFVEYLLPVIDPDSEAPTQPIVDGVDVRAAYRVGNRSGQGGMAMFGTWPGESADGR